jgi:ribonuclease HI
MLHENALNIYVDGSSNPNPGKGGIGILYIYVDSIGEEIREELCPPGYQRATSIKMELMAPIIALQNIPDMGIEHKYKNIYIFSDSKYVVGNYQRAKFQ